jgi:hypothetical protein
MHEFVVPRLAHASDVVRRAYCGPAGCKGIGSIRIYVTSVDSALPTAWEVVDAAGGVSVGMNTQIIDFIEHGVRSMLVDSHAVWMHVTNDDGFVGFLRELRQFGGKKCSRGVPAPARTLSLNESFTMETLFGATAVYGFLLAHEFAHVRTDQQCRVKGDPLVPENRLRIEMACDSIAVQTLKRDGGGAIAGLASFPIIQIAYYDAAERSAYTTRKIEYPGQPLIAERDWQRRVRQMLTVWGTGCLDGAVPGSCALEPGLLKAAEAALGDSLPIPCVP